MKFLWRLSIVAMCIDIALGGVSMMLGHSDFAFKWFFGAVGWAVCVFIFDALAKQKSK